MLQVPNVIVEVDWLHKHIENEDLIVLDATIPKVTAKGSIPVKEVNQIPNTRFFDIKGTFSEKNASFPNTMLSESQFEVEARALGINNDTCIVVYDTHGVYSSPRAWWMFKSMGFENIAVLNGGLPEWISKGYTTEKRKEIQYVRGNFKKTPTKEKLVNSDFVFNSLNHENRQILDARSLGRFKGEAPEPREKVRSGHIPNSKSLPYSSVLSTNKLKSKEELKLLYQEENEGEKQMIFSCGTGITACVLALGAAIAEYKDFVVYDGSWTEWGSIKDLPVEL